MIEVLMLIEKMMNDKVGDFNVNVKVNKTNGRLPNRQIFTRNVLRQSTLDEYMDMGIDSAPVLRHPRMVIYTVIPNHLRKDKLYALVDMLLKDLDEYLFSLR